MAEQVVKFPAEQKLTDKPLPAAEAPRKSWGQLIREKRRTLLLVVVPMTVVMGSALG